MEALQEIQKRIGLDTTFKPMTPREREQFQVDCLNNTVGNRNQQDGYECKLCKNKGSVFKLIEMKDGSYSHTSSECKCLEIRRSIMRMKRSGLKDIIKDYTFEKFKDAEPWQKSIKSAAMDFAHNPDGWFFIGGQVGAGKTHLCTAICREFLLEGRQVLYMLWRDEIVKIKANVNDPEAYGPLIDKYKTAEVLYIDDLFKTGRAADNSTQRPTPADINAAFEIINYRYNDPTKITIISSELSEDELLDIDEGVGSRIYERAKAITVAKDRNRNYRIKKTMAV